MASRARASPSMTWPTTVAMIFLPFSSRVTWSPTLSPRSVRNAGPATISPEAGRARANGTGHGLLGLRERVAVYGGHLDARRRLGGGYRVRARIPLDRP
ncbi:hypothetical protein [Streptomyces sp. cmx-4-9]|uniref:hypothetical protein n=1 Tax=Streptomyces sp. cmx-4-9 TaxID=2790941 RepID=UPI003980C2B7